MMSVCVHHVLRIPCEILGKNLSNPIKRKVLFVAMQDSVHTIKWIRQLKDCDDLDLHFFPISKTPRHVDLKGVVYHDPESPCFEAGIDLNREKPIVRAPTSERLAHGLQSFLGVRVYQYTKRIVKKFRPTQVTAPADLRALFPWMDDPSANDPRELARLIDSLKPDLIHSLEFQHCGYSVLSAKEYTSGAFPKWLATNWGSDIYYFVNKEEHKEMIKNLLHSADFYSCECHRDVDIVRALGYKNVVMPVIPNTGGIDIEDAAIRRSRLAPSQRKSILVKGYQSFAGRALTALDAIALCADDLAGYTIKVYSATAQTRQRVAELKSALNVQFEIIEKLDNSGMLDEFANARAYIGIGVSDGISTSSLEAMAMGAFPIQTNTSCCSEWFSDGVGGFIVPADDVALISRRIKAMLADDQLVDAASDSNWNTVRDRLDRKRVAQIAQGYYRTIFG